MASGYYADYQPTDPLRFEQMERVLSRVETQEALKRTAMLFLFDNAYAREDLLVVLGRIERARGWMNEPG